MLERVSLSSSGTNILTLLFATHCMYWLLLFYIYISVVLTHYMYMFDQINESKISVRKILNKLQCGHLNILVLLWLGKSWNINKIFTETVILFVYFIERCIFYFIFNKLTSSVWQNDFAKFAKYWRYCVESTAAGIVTFRTDFSSPY